MGPIESPSSFCSCDRNALRRCSFDQAVEPGIKLPLSNFEPVSAHQTQSGDSIASLKVSLDFNIAAISWGMVSIGERREDLLDSRLCAVLWKRNVG